MLLQEPLLVTLVRLVDRVPMPSPPPKRGRGRPRFYPDPLFLKALLIMILRRLNKVGELLSVLEQPTAEMQTLRTLLTQGGRYPTRRTFERRLKALPESLPAQIHCLGVHLLGLIAPWLEYGRAVAIDSTVLAAKGGVWHKKDREKGQVPHTSIDTQAHWTKSGWHGWVYGWKLHIVCVAAAVWIPLEARLTPANVADNEIAPALLDPLPAAVRFVLGDLHYNTEEIAQCCWRRGRELVTTQYGLYPHEDTGKEVRRVFHKLRSVAIENFNEHFKAIFDAHGQVPTRGESNTQRFALGAVFVYQIALLFRGENGLPLNQGLKPFLKAA